MFRTGFIGLAVQVFLLLSSGVIGAEACKAQSQSYSRCRLLAANGCLIPPEEIRADEWVNYMDYRLPPLPHNGEHQDRVGLWGAARLCPGEPGWSAFVMLVIRTAPYVCQREQPVDLAIVLDRSGSMAHENKMQFAHEGIRKLMANLAPGDRVGLLGFDTELQVERPLSSWKPGDDLSAELQRLQPRGGTDMHQGLVAGMDMLRNVPPAPDLPGDPTRVRRLLVITDAQTNTGVCNVDEVVKALEPGFKEGIRMTAIGVGLSYNDELLSRLTRIPGNNGRFLDRADEIGKSLQAIFDSLVPLDVDKPRLTLDLPDGVSVEESFGTPFVQANRQVNFPKLTSMGADDHQIILLRLKGSVEALRQVPGARLDLDGWSALEKKALRLSSTLKDIGDGTGTPPADPADAALAESLQKATTVALVADALKQAAQCASAKDFAGAGRAVTEAEDALRAYDPGGKDPEIGEVRAVVTLDRNVLDLLAREQGTGAPRMP